MYWVYILQNPVGMFYIGQTDDLSTRLANHNRMDETDGKFTRKNGPWTIVWSELHGRPRASVSRFTVSCRKSRP